MAKIVNEDSKIVTKDCNMTEPRDRFSAPMAGWWKIIPMSRSLPLETGILNWATMAQNRKFSDITKPWKF